MSAHPEASGRGGLHLMVGAAFTFSLMALCVKLAGQTLPSEQLVLFRAAVALVLSWVMLRRRGISPWGTHKGLLTLRGLAGFGGLSCYFYAVVHLPLADATVLQYVNPVLTAVLAAVVLGERLTWAVVSSILVSLTGVLLVTRPSLLFGGPGALDPVASGIALAGAVFSAIAYVTVRKIGTREHPLVIVFWFPLVATPLSLPAVLPVWVWPTWTGWVLLLAVGILTQIAQVLMTRGLQLEPAGRATAVSYLQVVFATLWGVLIFHEVPDGWTLSGALLIVSSAFLLLRGAGKARRQQAVSGGARPPSGTR